MIQPMDFEKNLVELQYVKLRGTKRPGIPTIFNGFLEIHRLDHQTTSHGMHIQLSTSFPPAYITGSSRWQRNFSQGCKSGAVTAPISLQIYKSILLFVLSIFMMKKWALWLIDDGRMMHGWNDRAQFWRQKVALFRPSKLIKKIAKMTANMLPKSRSNVLPMRQTRSTDLPKTSLLCDQKQKEKTFYFKKYFLSLFLDQKLGIFTTRLP